MSDQQPPLHNSIVALVSLAANIAANHPKQGLCQLERLREMGIAEQQIATVIEIARHIRDEAGEKLDTSFDEAAQIAAEPATKPSIPVIQVASDSGSCCTPTSSGQSCC